MYDIISHAAHLISAMSLCLEDPALQHLRTATQRFVNVMMMRRMMTMKRIDNGGDDDHNHVYSDDDVFHRLKHVAVLPKLVS